MSHRTTVLRMVAFFAGTAFSGADGLAQDTLYEVPEGQVVVERVADLDGDGVPDLLSGRDGGGALLLSGVNGAILREHLEDGIAVHAAGGPDLDGDGVSDYVLSYAQPPQVWSVVYSGADGTEIDRDSKSFYSALLGDIDGDGLAEWVVSDRFLVMLVYSSVDGSILYSAADLIRPQVVGDLDGDGFDDLALNDWAAGEIVFLSGVDGQELRRFAADLLQDAGLVDRDDVADVIGFDRGTGEVVVFSGADGAEIHRFLPPGGSDFLTTVSIVGDVDGDGHGDLIVSEAREADPDGAWKGVSRLISGRTGLVQYTFGDPVADDIHGAEACPLADLDGDGLVEFALATGRRVQVLRGASLFLDFWPRFDVTELEVFTVTTSPSIPGSLALRFILSVNGSPLFFRIDAAQIDASGQRVKQVSVPPGLGSMDLEQVAFAFDLSGRLRATTIEVLRLR